MCHLPSHLKPYKKSLHEIQTGINVAEGSGDCKLQPEINLNVSSLQTFPFSIQDIGDRGNTQVKR